MLLWRREPRTAVPCPECDAPVDLGLADQAEPRCPGCGTALAPIRVAGFWRRALAGALDMVLLLLTAGVMSYGLLQLVPPTPVVQSPPGMAALLELLAASPRSLLAWSAPFLIMSALYLSLFWGLSGQTPPQRLLRIRVVNRHGTVPGPLLAGVRVAAFAAGLLPGALGALWIAFDLHKRGFHDHVAGTYVILEAGATA